MKDIKKKKELIAAARVALSNPDADAFWTEVQERLDAEEKRTDNLVKPRDLRD